MSGNKSAFLLKKDLKNANLLSLEGSPNGMAAVSKTAGRKPLEVRLLYPPHTDLKVPLGTFKSVLE